MKDLGRIAFVTAPTITGFYEIHVYSVLSGKVIDSTKNQLEEDKKHVVQDPNISINDIAIQADMLVYASSNLKTGDESLTFLNLNPTFYSEAWTITTAHLVNYNSYDFRYRLLKYINLSSSAFLATFQNGNIFICHVQELIKKFMNSNNKELLSEIMSKPVDGQSDRFFYTSTEHPNILNVLNNTEYIVRSTCLDACGSFAFLSDGHGDKVKLYYSPSVINLSGDLATKDISYRTEEREDSDVENSLC